MKTLILFRHAKALSDDPSGRDHERGLASRGMENATAMGAKLQAEGIVPDYILCSPARRTTDTVRLAAAGWNRVPPLQWEKDLYQAYEADFVNALHHAPEHAACVMIVGHNDGLQEFLCRLTGTGRAVPTCTVGVVELPIPGWAEMCTTTRGKLLKLWTPDDL